MNSERPRSSESATRMLVCSATSGSRIASAHTGAPACASTTLTPTARISVLLPDMFDPVTSRKRPFGPIETSLVTRVPFGSRA